MKLIDEAHIWTKQTDVFFHFLLAQGFVVSEQDLADFFQEKANSMTDLRSNTHVKTELELRMKDAMNNLEGCMQ
jgi:hypothetical protein